MNLIKRLRHQVGATQQELARVAHTSQSAVAAYESGVKSPTLKTAERLAACFNLEIFAQLHPPMTREERRSLAFHVAIAVMLERDPAKVIRHAKHNLAMLRRLHPHASSLLDRWRGWLTLESEDLVELMLSPSLTAREMRQVSPFSGMLDNAQRTKIIAKFQADHAA